MDFPGKILLFGEYGILLNSMALSVPFSRFSGKLRFPDSSSGVSPKKVATSRAELGRLYLYLKSQSENIGFLDTEKFGNDLKHGLYFDSSIPNGAGLGSSGALTAAVYARYARAHQGEGFSETRKHLAIIESCFHGQSSGIDPLTSYYNKPILLENATSEFKLAKLTLFFQTYSLFLINTHQKGSTGEMVSHFIENYKEPYFRKKIDNEYLPLINQTIKAILSEDFETFESSMKGYSSFQLIWFERMIPATLKQHMDYGTKTGDFYIKLCGSGGGGYMLAIARNSQKAGNYFNSNQLDFSIVKQIETSNQVLSFIIS